MGYGCSHLICGDANTRPRGFGAVEFAFQRGWRRKIDSALRTQGERIKMTDVAVEATLSFEIFNASHAPSNLKGSDALHLEKVRDSH